MSTVGKHPVNGKDVVVKVAATGLFVLRKVRPAGEVYGTMPKADARRLRKAVRAAGRGDLAAAPRQTLKVVG
jgi:hypothetical protein